MSQKDFWTTEPCSIWTNPPHTHSATKSMCKPLNSHPPCPFLSLHFLSLYLQPTLELWFSPRFPSLSLWLSSSSSVLPPGSMPSDKGQDAVDEQGHDGSAEQAGDGHCDEPCQEDVPEEAPVHRFLRADPAHGHDWAHLEAAARRGERKHQREHRTKALTRQRQCEELQVVHAFLEMEIFQDQLIVLCLDKVSLLTANWVDSWWKNWGLDRATQYICGLWYNNSQW